MAKLWKFPSPYGVSFIPIGYDVDFICPVMDKFPSPYGVIFILTSCRPNTRKRSGT